MKEIIESELREFTYKDVNIKDIAKYYECSYVTICNYRRKLNINKYQQYIGEKFNKLTVIDSFKDGIKVVLKCVCDCGNIVLSKPDRVLNNIKISCGCIRPTVKNGKTASISSKFRNRARRRNLEFTLTNKDLQELIEKQNFKCALTGEELTTQFKHNCAEYNASLDRIDSSKGYIEGNVQWVTKDINFAKYKMSQEDFINLCKKVVDYNT